MIDWKDRAVGKSETFSEGQASMKKFQGARVSVLTRGWGAVMMISAVVVLGGPFDDDKSRQGRVGGSGRVIGKFDHPIHKVAFSPDDSLVAGLQTDGRLMFWELAPKGWQSELGGNDLHITSFAFAPDGLTVAFGDNQGIIRFWDIQTGQETGWIQAGTRSVMRLTYSPDGRWLASGEETGQLALWDVVTRQCHWNICPHLGSFSALAFSRDSQWLASAGTLGMVTAWKVKDGEARASISDSLGNFDTLVFSPDGQAILWVNTINRTMRRWCPGSGKGVEVVGTEVETMTPSPDGRSILIRTSGGALQLRDAQTFQVNGRGPASPTSLASFAVSNDGSRLVLGTINALTLHDLQAP